MMVTSCESLIYLVFRGLKNLMNFIAKSKNLNTFAIRFTEVTGLD